MKPLPYEKAYTDRLINKLKRGVQSRRYFGNIEPDVNDADETMYAAAEVIKNLLKEMNKNQNFGDMAELVDASVLGTDALRRGGSSPSIPTKVYRLQKERW